MANYRVTEAVNAEREAIRLLTEELDRLKAKRTADVAEVRRWRMRFMAWYNSIQRRNKKALQLKEHYSLISRMVSEYNSLIDEASSTNSLSYGDSVNQYGELLSEIQEAIDRLRANDIGDDYEELLTSTETELDDAQVQLGSFLRASQRYSQQNDRYQDYLVEKRHNDELRAKYEDYVALEKEYEGKLALYENNVATENSRVARLQRKVDSLSQEIQSINANEYETQLVRFDRNSLAITPNDKAVEAITNKLIENAEYDELGAPLRGNLWSILGTPDLSRVEDELESGNRGNAYNLVRMTIKERLDAWIKEEKGRLPTVNELERREIKPPIPPEKVDPVPEIEKVNPPVEVEPVDLPVFNSHIDYQMPKTDEVRIPASLMNEIQSYASGKYINTTENISKINTLAAQIGYDCPKISQVNTTFDKSGVNRAILEIEASWSGFGSQRNSTQGIAAIEKLKRSIDDLKDSTNYKELQKSGVHFNEASTQLFIWLTNNWWQLGGSPSGNAHTWKGTNARRLVSPKKK